MAFIRIKKIKGNEYGYLIENEWTPHGSRQKSTKYLGKIVRFLDREELDIHDFLGSDLKSFLMGKRFPEVILKLIEYELSCFGFEHEEGIWKKDKYGYSKKKTFQIGGKEKPVVIALNEGFLCEQSIIDLLGFEPIGYDEREVAIELANKMVEAGLRVPESAFIAIFETYVKKEFEKREKRREALEDSHNESDTS